MTDCDMLTIDGVTKPIVEWALDYGIYPNVITDRLERGWSVDRAVTTPMIATPRQRLLVKHLRNLPALKRIGRPPGRKAPGVVRDLPASLGTGGGPIAQDISEIEFSQ